ncbi:hypothetical protein BH20ACT23_BH20ACT23_28180 [soil metagenome]
MLKLAFFIIVESRRISTLLLCPIHTKSVDRNEAVT